jgi:hypothetical protein
MDKTAFPVGLHLLHQDVSMNFQMNRWFSWVGEPGMLDEMRSVAPRITNYVDWKRDFWRWPRTPKGKDMFSERASTFVLPTSSCAPTTPTGATPAVNF